MPTPDGVVNPLVLAAAEIAGVDEIYRIGGAQAVAALAYGTASIAPVDKIVGPGNAYVAEAKRQVFGRVGIDMIAGPSEIVIVAEAGGRPGLGRGRPAVAGRARRARPGDPDHRRRRRSRDGWSRRSSVSSTAWSAAPSPRPAGASMAPSSSPQRIEARGALVDALAPEHLELIGPRAEALAAAIRHAGAIFLGPFTPEVIGDYVGGPNHVLPTGRTARFASGLAVHDFLKRTTLLGCDRAGFAQLAPAAAVLARAEGLQAHALAVERRLEALA